MSTLAYSLQFQALLTGPKGAEVWARAWISDENGTLAETMDPNAVVGDLVALEVAKPTTLAYYIAVIRIESKLLEREHILLWKFS